MFAYGRCSWRLPPPSNLPHLSFGNWTHRVPTETVAKANCLAEVWPLTLGPVPGWFHWAPPIPILVMATPHATCGDATAVWSPHMFPYPYGCVCVNTAVRLFTWAFVRAHAPPWPSGARLLLGSPSSCRTAMLAGRPGRPLMWPAARTLSGLGPAEISARFSPALLLVVSGSVSSQGLLCLAPGIFLEPKSSAQARHGTAIFGKPTAAVVMRGLSQGPWRSDAVPVSLGDTALSPNPV